MSSASAVWGKIGLAVVSAAAVVFLLLVLAGVFHDKVEPAPPAADGRNPPAGVAVEVAAIELPSEEWAVGSVEAVHETTIGARILSTVVRVHVEAGQEVEQDHLLIELDSRDLAARRDQAAARVAVAEAARDQAQSDYDRIAPLAADGSASAFELTTARNALRSAEAELRRAVQDHREAETVLTYAEIRAPVSGRIVDKLVDAGDIVTPGQHLLTMYDPTRMQLVASVRESLRQRLEVGQTVGVKLDTLDHVCDARVSEIVPEAETASRSFLVKVTGPCPPGIYPGMFGRLRVPLGTRQAICVPDAAVRAVGQLDLVDVVEDGVPRQRLVQLGGRLDGGRVEVLSGLAPGERVLVPAADAAGSEAGRGA